MVNKSVKRLRNKFCFILMSSFLLLMILAGLVIYIIIASQRQQAFHQSLNNFAFAERVIGAGLSSSDFFTVELDNDHSVLTILSEFPLEMSEYEALVGWALNQENNDVLSLDENGNNFLRNSSLLFGSSQYLEIGGRRWAFTFMEQFTTSDLDHLGEDGLTIAEQILQEITLRSGTMLQNDGVDDHITYSGTTVVESDLIEVSIVDTANILEQMELLYNAKEQRQYIIFVDATLLIEDLRQLGLLLFNLGLLGLILIWAMSYLLSYLLTRPIARNFSQQEQFITDASHELKTPLTILKSNFAVLLENKEESVESQMEWLGNMEFAFERMIHLTKDLLTLSRLNDRHERLEKNLFDLSEITQRVIHTFKTQAAEKNITITSQLLPQLIVNQDIEKITQVITILLDNAIKYSEVGGIVAVELEKTRNRVRFTIKNTGSGIEASKLSHIFDRFYKVDDARNSESSSYGLGLAIAKEIIDKSGGKIQAQSTPNVETIFSFTIKI